MAERMRVAGSMWSVPPAARAGEAHRLREAGLEVLHWDTTDGVFAREGGFSVEAAAAMTAETGLRAEAHLMVTDPLARLDAWTGFCELVVVHAEAEGWRAALDRIERRGSRPALALSPGTPATSVPSRELAVLTMSVVPGEAGATFDESALATVRALREAASGAPRLLGLDGGVTRDIGIRAAATGAGWLVSGTDLFRSPAPRAWLSDVRDAHGPPHD
ncbi:hypothetical protein OG589_16575 [Sphaerisporangium sp. NBC_01403]|uniref:hypothetical protein n=1 Tax=Sphaerisporangium sp. NBC_01403 TaxID=2903599 RepID=UPI003249CF85